MQSIYLYFCHFIILFTVGVNVSHILVTQILIACTYLCNQPFLQCQMSLRTQLTVRQYNRLPFVVHTLDRAGTACWHSLIGLFIALIGLIDQKCADSSLDISHPAEAPNKRHKNSYCRKFSAIFWCQYLYMAVLPGAIDGGRWLC